VCATLSFIVLLIIELPFLVFKLSLIAYPIMYVGWFNYTRKKISVETIFALHILIFVQIIAWVILGTRIV
jgi:hypothetical protein